jgi:hypothetical protein
MLNLILGSGRKRRTPEKLQLGEMDSRTRLILEDLLSVRAHADMRANAHTALILAGLVASGAFAAGMVTAGLDKVRESTLLFLLVPVLYMVAFSLYLDVSRSVYLAEEYINRVASQAFPQIWLDHNRVAWYWERFASEGRRPLYMKVVGGIKAGGAFVVPTVGSLAAFWHFHSPSPWTRYESALFWVDVSATVLLVIVGQMVHHLGRPVTSPDEKLTWRQKLRRFFW